MYRLSLPFLLSLLFSGTLSAQDSVTLDVPVRHLVFSPKGDYLVTVGDAELFRTWETESWKLNHHKRPKGTPPIGYAVQPVRNIYFSPNGKFVCMGDKCFEARGYGRMDMSVTDTKGQEVVQFHPQGFELFSMRCLQESTFLVGVNPTNRNGFTWQAKQVGKVNAMNAVGSAEAGKDEAWYFSLRDSKGWKLNRVRKGDKDWQTISTKGKGDVILDNNRDFLLSGNTLLKLNPAEEAWSLKAVKSGDSRINLFIYPQQQRAAMLEYVKGKLAVVYRDLSDGKISTSIPLPTPAAPPVLAVAHPDHRFIAILFDNKPGTVCIYDRNTGKYVSALSETLPIPMDGNLEEDKQNLSNLVLMAKVVAYEGGMRLVDMAEGTLQTGSQFVNPFQLPAATTIRFVALVNATVNTLRIKVEGPDGKPYEVSNSNKKAQSHTFKGFTVQAIDLPNSGAGTYRVTVSGDRNSTDKIVVLGFVGL